METATWVIAGASVVNVLVLVAYAWFTWGIWRETREGGARTEKLVQQARDALKLQLLAILLQVRQEALSRGLRQPDEGIAPGREERAARRLLGAAFPAEWPAIEPTLRDFYGAEEK